MIGRSGMGSCGPDDDQSCVQQDSVAIGAPLFAPLLLGVFARNRPAPVPVPRARACPPCLSPASGNGMDGMKTDEWDGVGAIVKLVRIPGKERGPTAGPYRPFTLHHSPFTLLHTGDRHPGPRHGLQFRRSLPGRGASPLPSPLPTHGRSSSPSKWNRLRSRIWPARTWSSTANAIVGVPLGLSMRG